MDADGKEREHEYALSQLNNSLNIGEEIKILYLPVETSSYLIENDTIIKTVQT